MFMDSSALEDLHQFSAIQMFLLLLLLFSKGSLEVEITDINIYTVNCLNSTPYTRRGFILYFYYSVSDIRITTKFQWSVVVILSDQTVDNSPRHSLTQKSAMLEIVVFIAIPQFETIVKGYPNLNL